MDGEFARPGDYSASKRTFSPRTPAQPSTRRKQPLSFLDLYRPVQQLLGVGAFSEVKVFCSVRTKKNYAVKIVPAENSYIRGKILKEVELYSALKHDNIIELNEYHEESGYFYLVFPMMSGGTLLHAIEEQTHLSERDASLVIKQVASALAYMHSKGVAHRDLKPDNILCERQGSINPVKVCDFDLGSRLITSRTPITTPKLLTPVGSAQFLAPEVVRVWCDDKASPYNKKCDLWSLGVILYIMLCGYPPFCGQCGGDCGWDRGTNCENCENNLFQQIQHGSLEFPEADWTHVGTTAQHLIQCLLERNPLHRISAVDVLSHPWIMGEGSAALLRTPSLLQRHNSIKDLEVFAQNAVAYNRIVTQKLANSSQVLPENTTTAAATPKANLFQSDLTQRLEQCAARGGGGGGGGLAMKGKGQLGSFVADRSLNIDEETFDEMVSEYVGYQRQVVGLNWAAECEDDDDDDDVDGVIAPPVAPQAASLWFGASADAVPVLQEVDSQVNGDGVVSTRDPLYRNGTSADCAGDNVRASNLRHEIHYLSDDQHRLNQRRCNTNFPRSAERVESIDFDGDCATEQGRVRHSTVTNEDVNYRRGSLQEATADDVFAADDKCRSLMSNVICKSQTFDCAAADDASTSKDPKRAKNDPSPQSNQTRDNVYFNGEVENRPPKTSNSRYSTNNRSLLGSDGDCAELHYSSYEEAADAWMYGEPHDSDSGFCAHNALRMPAAEELLSAHYERVTEARPRNFDAPGDNSPRRALTDSSGSFQNSPQSGSNPRLAPPTAARDIQRRVWSLSRDLRRKFVLNVARAMSRDRQYCERAADTGLVHSIEQVVSKLGGQGGESLSEVGGGAAVFRIGGDDDDSSIATDPRSDCYSPDGSRSEKQASFVGSDGVCSPDGPRHLSFSEHPRSAAFNTGVFPLQSHTGLSSPLESMIGERTSSNGDLSVNVSGVERLGDSRECLAVASRMPLSSPASEDGGAGQVDGAAPKAVASLDRCDETEKTWVDLQQQGSSNETIGSVTDGRRARDSLIAGFQELINDVIRGDDVADDDHFGDEVVGHVIGFDEDDDDEDDDPNSELRGFDPAEAMACPTLDSSMTNFKEKVADWTNTFHHAPPPVAPFHLKDPSGNELAIRRGELHPRISEGSDGDSVNTIDMVSEGSSGGTDPNGSGWVVDEGANGSPPPPIPHDDPLVPVGCGVKDLAVDRSVPTSGS